MFLPLKDNFPDGTTTSCKKDWKILPLRQVAICPAKNKDLLI